MHLVLCGQFFHIKYEASDALAVENGLVYTISAHTHTHLLISLLDQTHRLSLVVYNIVSSWDVHTAAQAVIVA